MTSINVVSPGQTFTIDVVFLSPNNTAFAPTSPAQFNIRDYNGNLVLSGSGTQDMMTTGRWYATVTLPDTVPVGDDTQRYYVNWTASNTSVSLQYTDVFLVAYVNDFQFIDNNRTILEMQQLTDALSIPSTVTIDSGSLDVQLMNEFGTVLFDARTQTTNPISSTATYQNGYNVWTLTSATAANLIPGVYSNHDTPYFLVWTWTVAGVPYTEIHFIWIMPIRMTFFMQMLRSRIDRARNKDINPYLIFTDSDLAMFLSQGIKMLNGFNPCITRFDFKHIPFEFEYALIECAIVCAFEAQLPAEGVSAFDFSGQSVTLNVNRTEQISAALDRSHAWLDANLQKQKKAWMRRGGGTPISAGILGVTQGASTNRLVSARNSIGRLQSFAAFGNFGGLGGGFA